MNKVPLLLTAGILTAVAPLSAAWELVDDFEGDSSNPAFTYVVALGSRESPTFNFLTDPLDAENTVLWIDPETYGTEWTNVYATWPLPSSIAEESVGTYYFRYYVTASDAMGFAVGLTDVPYAEEGDPPVPTAPSEWADFESAVALGNRFGPWDGSYVTTDYTWEVGTWYEIWGVITNATGVLDDKTEWYIKAPGDAEPVHVPIPDGNGGYFDSALFRNGTTDPLISFIWGVNAGSPTAPKNGVPSYIDDIYVTTNGKDLTSPVSGSTQTWGGFPVQNGYVDTGSFFGTIYLHPSNPSWVYAYSLNKWVWFPDPGDNGGWTYIVR